MPTTDAAAQKNFEVDAPSPHPLVLSEEGIYHHSRFLRRRKSMMSVGESAKSRFANTLQHRSSESSSSEETLDPKSSTRRQSLARATVSSMAKVVPNGLKRRNSMMNLSSSTSTSFAPPPQPTGSMSILKSSSVLTGDITTTSTPRRAGLLLHPPNRRSTVPVLPTPSQATSLPRPVTKQQQQPVIVGNRPTTILNTPSPAALRRRASVQHLDTAVASTEIDHNRPSRCRHGANNRDAHQPIWLRRQTKCAACNPNPTPLPTPQQQQQQQTETMSPRNVSPPPSAAATAAAAMAAAAAVVSAAAATAVSSGPVMGQHNPKWVDLITHCVAHSNRLEKLAQEILGQESRTDRVVSRQTSLEDLQQAREETHQQKIKECESLVKAQRSMLLELEGLLAEFGVAGSAPTTPTTELDTQDEDDVASGVNSEALLTTPPPSSPSASSSLPSMPPSPTTSSENNIGYGSIKAATAAPASAAALPPLTQQQQAASAAASAAAADWTQFVDESVSRFRWTISQWFGGPVGIGQCVKNDDQSMVISGKAFTTEPNLLPLHLAGPLSTTQTESVYYHQYVLEVTPNDRKTRLALLPDTQWVPDVQVSCCEFSYADDKEGKCSAEFSWAVRRHHCRRCGHVFCNIHSSNRLPLFKTEKPEWSRVCDSCFYKVAGSSLFHPADCPSSQ